MLRITESDRYGLLMASIPTDTSASLRLSNGDRVENLVQEDESPSHDLFVGIYDATARAEVLTLDGPIGRTECRFDVEKREFAPACEPAG
jgi:hypothetical protein